MLRANIGATAVFLALALAATLLPNYLVFLAISGIIQTLILLSLGVIVGRAGMISLGQLAFAGVGAWRRHGCHSTRHGFPSPSCFSWRVWPQLRSGRCLPCRPCEFAASTLAH